MLFEADPFAYCIERFTVNHMYHINTYWLPKRGGKTKAVFAGRKNPGGFQFLERSAFSIAGGYDERIVYRGCEDLDWIARLKRLGFVQEWLPPEYRIYHQWHRPSESGFLRPATATYSTAQHCYENAFKPNLDGEWGHLMMETDRPILKAMRESPATVIELRTDEMNDISCTDRLAKTKEAGFVRIEFGPRLKGRSLDDLTARVLVKSLRQFGLAVSPAINSNIDFFTAVLPVLEENGLVDYYLEPDFKRVYLLWR